MSSSSAVAAAFAGTFANENVEYFHGGIKTYLKTYTGCLQNQANKFPGFFQDFQEFFKQFSRICLHKMSTVIQET